MERRPRKVRAVAATEGAEMELVATITPVAFLHVSSPPGLRR
jgi:hypothetical protein